MSLSDAHKTDPHAETLRGRWPNIVQHSAQIAKNPGSTVRPASDDRAQARVHAALNQLANVRPALSNLTLEEPIGEGAMGVVRLATQRSLGRKVAVKAVKPSARSDKNIASLLQEAWVTGMLEHPNVVPVYDMGIDQNGHPLIVLKRIEGTEWAQLLHAPELLADRYEADDPLEWHVRTLMRVCTATHFAHNRGIIHRDLKPENVMIGGYDEVYLVDWGIALSLEPDPSGRLPCVADAVNMGGTPCYMAPEMLGGDPPTLSTRTDVYLLGAILYHILAGAPPHQGESVFEILRNAMVSTPEMPADAPDALVSVCQKAMARDPADRFESADAVRRALQQWLNHRGSMALARQAERQMGTLLAVQSFNDDRAARYRAFGACRFGFRQALAEWPGNERAKDGLRRVTAHFAHLELQAGDHRGAAGLLAELDTPPPALLKRLAVARTDAQSEAKRVAKLENLGTNLNPNIARLPRLFFALSVGIWWTVIPIIRAEVLGHHTYTSLMTSMGIMLALFILVFWKVPALRATSFNRRIGGTVILALTALLVLDVGAHMLGLSLIQTRPIHSIISAVVIGMAALSIERRLIPSTLSYTIAFLISARWPDLTTYTISMSNLLMTLNVLWVWTARGSNVVAPSTSG